METGLECLQRTQRFRDATRVALEMKLPLLSVFQTVY